MGASFHVPGLHPRIVLNYYGPSWHAALPCFLLLFEAVEVESGNSSRKRRRPSGFGRRRAVSKAVVPDSGSL